MKTEILEFEINKKLIDKVKNILNEYELTYSLDIYDKGLSKDKLELYNKEFERVNCIINSIYEKFEETPVELETTIKKLIKNRDDIHNKLMNNKLIIFTNERSLENNPEIFNDFYNLVTKETSIYIWDKDETIYTTGNNIIFGYNDGDGNSRDRLEYYKNELLNGCEDSLIDKKLIDSLFNEKILLLKEFSDVEVIFPNKFYKLNLK